MIVKAKHDIVDLEIKEGAIGLAFENKFLEIRVKNANLTEDKKEELLKLLGDRAEEFLAVHRRTHRIAITQSGLKYDLGAALPIYDIDGLEDFEEVKFSSLPDKNKAELKELENSLYAE